MTFSVSGQIVTQNTATTDNDQSALVTLINGIPTVARSTLYTVGQVVRPPSGNGFMYRCSVQGTTAASAPTYGTAEGGTTVDGGAQFVAHQEMRASLVTVSREISMGTFMLRINGTLTHNPDYELLTFGDVPQQAIIVNTGGTYNYGVEYTQGGVLTYSTNTGLKFTNTIGFWPDAYNGGGRTCLNVSTGATFRWRGGSMLIRGAGWYFHPGSTILVRQGRARVEATGSVLAGRGVLCTITSTTMDIDGLRVTGRAEVNIRNSLGASTVRGLVVEHGAYGLAFDTDDAIPGFIEVPDVDVAGRGHLTADYFYSSSGVNTTDAAVMKVRIRNAAQGSVGTYAAGNSGLRERGVWEQVQDERFTTRTAAGSAIAGAIVYVKDKNNGQRRNGFGLNYVDDRVYIGATNASGQTTQNILVSAVVDTVSGTGGMAVDYRCESGNTTDDFNFQTWSYLHQPASGQFITKGTGTKEVPVTLFADTGVTLTQAQAAALTQIDTLDQLYDAGKDWKCQAQQARLEYPSISTQPVTASGAALDLGNRNLVIDGTAAADFAINTGTNTITIKSSALAVGAKFKSLTTTGTLTRANGGTITAPFTDADNASQIVVTGPAATDTVEMRKASDNSLIATRTGPGAFAVSPANVGVSVYFERKVGAVLVMSTQTTPVTLSTINDDVPMFAGPQVAVANVDGMAKEETLLLRPTLAQMTAGGIALEASVQTRATQASVNAIPTNPLLTTDTRLNNLDAAISTRSTLTAPQVRTELATELGRIDVAVSSRLATSAYTAPTTPPTAVQIRQEIDTNSTKLDVAVGTRLAASSYVAPTTAPSAADNAAAVRTNLATELARIDVATSTRLATAGYTAPANADIAAIKAKTDTLVNGPTLAQIEASTVLAKEATVNTRATQTSVNAIPTNPLLTNDARVNNLDAAVSSRLATAAYTAPPTVAAIRADIERTGGMLDVLPTLAEMTASTLAKQSDLTGLATAANVTNAQTAIVGEINANETKIDAVKADTAAIKAKTDTLTNSTAPTVAQIRAELETAGSKLDTAAKKSKAAWVNTL